MLKVFLLFFTVFSIAQTSHAGNARLSPLSLLIGALDGDVTFFVNENITLGPSFTFLSLTLLDTKISAQSLGARMNYFPTYMPSEDGMYFGLELTTGSIKIEDVSLQSSGEVNFTGLTGLVGYQWVWDSGFNLNLGAGVGTASVGSVKLKNSAGEETKDYSGTGVSGSAFALEFGMGYIF